MTDWSGFCMDSLSTSADGRRLAFRRLTVQSSVYLADLQFHGTRISAPRPLTLNEGRDYPAAWTADSKAVVFVSNRNGQSEIFRQSLGEEDTHAIPTLSEGGDEPASAGLLSRVVPRMSPDGTWVLYMVWERATGLPAPVKLMRVPLLGGPPQLVMTTSLDIIHSMRCTRSPASLCAIAERAPDRKQLIFTGFDPVFGRGRELARFVTNSTPDAEYVWHLSPDGTRIAILKRSEAAISVLSLSGQPLQEVVVKGWHSLQSLDWLADGTGLYLRALYAACGSRRTSFG